MKKILLLILCSFLIIKKTYPSGKELSISGNAGLFSIWTTTEKTPFWFWPNRLGAIPLKAGFIQAGNISLNGNINQKSPRPSIFFGAQFTGYTGQKNKLKLTETYGGLKTKHFVFQCGAVADTVVLNGLSISNGNLLNSGNASPYPRVSIQTNGFIRLFKAVDFAVHWDEGILPGNRIVKKPLLHHKNLFIRYNRPENLYVTLGVDHYAFWGGESPTAGTLPHGLDDYLRIVTTSKGDSEYNPGDRLNVAGNHIGQYLLIVGKEFSKLKIEARIVHPFEDGSGMRLVNVQDNLYGLFIDLKKTNFIESVNLEYLYSVNQSGGDSGENGYSHLHGRDNYFNHGQYQSGFTYQGYMMGLPLFYPISTNTNGIVSGITNNRIKAFHLGLSGSLSEQVFWKLMLTFSRNYGTYSTPFTPARNQFSGFGNFVYSPSKWPVYFKIALGYDKGSNLNNGINRTNTGIQFTIGCRW